MNIEIAICGKQLPLMGPTIKLSKGIRHWPHLSDIPNEEIKGEVLVLIRCDLQEAHRVLEQRLGGRNSPYAARTLIGSVVFGTSSCAACKVESVNCVPTWNFRLPEQLLRIHEDFSYL